ncbi:kunitz-type protease inhibitor 3 [Grammomys surdaster]|uniref:kunitz-type protease inhibitor 3 n=1 Tax=Grammomys surdaster TaxID=491861 RepID=UPI0010A020F1|nr:kunitz-type protease inhibitor 3 [Grammomys surdaster]
MQLQASFFFFLMLIFCQELCSEQRKVPRKSLPPVCTLPKERGECRAMFVRWYYNSKIGRCDWFHYGGCRGNQNNFLSRYQCQAFCTNI